jgi:hypothetical protein
MLGTTGPRVPAHQVTTRNLGAAYPFIAEAGLGQRGVVIGDDLLGGSFVFDPFELYAQGVVSNPNMVVFGQIGRGKSSFVKTFLWRQAVFGRRAWVVDPKGEYGDLGRRLGCATGGPAAGWRHPAQPPRLGSRARGRPDGRRGEHGPPADGAAVIVGVPVWVGLSSPGSGPPSGWPCRGRPRGRPCPQCLRSSMRSSSPRPTPPPRCAPDCATCSRMVATWRSSCAVSSTATCAACSTGRPPLAWISRPGRPRPLRPLHLDRLGRAHGLRHGLVAGCAGPHLILPAGHDPWHRAGLPGGGRGVGHPVQGEDSINLCLVRRRQSASVRHSGLPGSDKRALRSPI